MIIIKVRHRGSCAFKVSDGRKSLKAASQQEIKWVATIHLMFDSEISGSGIVSHQPLLRETRKKKLHVK